jgi:hypothetical protein
MIEQFESEISNELKWNNVENIPNFPMDSFTELQNAISNKTYSVGVDFTTANQLSSWIFGKVYTVLYFILTWVPYIVIAASIVLAIALNNYWMIIGIALAFFGMLFSNPYNPAKSFWSFISVVIFCVFVYGVLNKSETIALLSAFFVVPFFTNSYLYKSNSYRVRKLALSSEKVFIYLFQNDKMYLRNNATNKIHSHQ